MLLPRNERKKEKKKQRTTDIDVERIQTENATRDFRPLVKKQTLPVCTGEKDPAGKTGDLVKMARETIHIYY